MKEFILFVGGKEDFGNGASITTARSLDFKGNAFW